MSLRTLAKVTMWPVEEKTGMPLRVFILLLVAFQKSEEVSRNGRYGRNGWEEVIGFMFRV